MYGQTNTAIQWQRTLGGAGEDLLNTTLQTQDGGYILGGYSSSDISGDKIQASKGGADYWIVKLDAIGNIQWQKTIGGSSDDFLRGIIQMPDGNYILYGYSSSGISGDKTDASKGGNDCWIVKINAQGSILWQKSIGGNDAEELYIASLTNDNGIIIGASSASDISGDKTQSSRGDFDCWIIKLDETGVIQWQKTIGGDGKDIIRAIQQTTDGGYFVGAQTLSDLSGDKTEASEGNRDMWLLKLDVSGNIEWQNTIGGSAEDILLTAHQKSSGSFFIDGGSLSPVSGDKTEASFNGNSDLWILQLNESGTIIGQKTIGGDLWDAIYDMKSTPDGGFIVGANSVSSASIDKTEDSKGGVDYWILKVDSSFNIKWQNTIGGNNDDYLLPIQQTFDGGYIIGGYSSSDAFSDKTENSKGGNDFWIIKLIVDPRYITGTVFGDSNGNCVQNSGDKGMRTYSLKASKGNYRSFTSTDTSGKYNLPVNDTGNYTIELLPNLMYPLYTASDCNNYNVFLSDSIINRDFYERPLIQCALNTVSISASSVFRRCIENTFYVSYCNNGTIVSPDTYIDITLDRYLTLNSAAISYTDLGNNVFRFNIGNLNYLSCGNFTFNATPRCDSTILGQTICAEAHIYPDTVCTIPFYNGSYILASAKCLGDSIQLKIENKNAGMTQQKKYKVIEGNVMRMLQNYQLPQNGSVIVTLPADSGFTYRIIAEREDNFPVEKGDKFVTAAFEGCRTDQSLNFSTGFYTQFSSYDGEPYRSLCCNVIIGSFDPNDKVAYPLGYALPHYLEANTNIDYQINFQNTGTDTAFKVVVVDTISGFLDINSIELNANSHKYTFERIDSNVIRFVFDNIKLVDSSTNERLSHGFVKFSIRQKNNNPLGTVIYNSADIYFDYNAPVITNKTYHTIGKDFIQVNLISGISSPGYKVKEVKIMPNPFREKTEIIVVGSQLKNPVLRLMDAEGRLVKTIPSYNNNSFIIQREDIAGGVYYYSILQGNDMITSGKLIAQ
ncbi:MAG: T9SS type A sorting domain-containing protein [Chitinophagales bacterium]|nr:T9SS type A sorting domain-containing protein [Chitinophagales bacterium]